MDSKFQTSFIPKRPIVSGNRPTAVKQSLNLFSIIGVFVFIVATALSAGVFLYEKTLFESNNSKKEDIKKEISAFDPVQTRQLTVVKTKIDGVNELLRNHIALTEFFDLLQKNTVSTILFKDFKYSGDPGATLSVVLKGEAKSFNDVVLQSDTILKNKYIKNAIFSDFDLDENSNVQFSLKADIDSDYVSYEKMIGRLSKYVAPAETRTISIATTSTATTSTTSTTSTTTRTSTP